MRRWGGRAASECSVVGGGLVHDSEVWVAVRKAAAHHPRRTWWAFRSAAPRPPTQLHLPLRPPPPPPSNGATMRFSPEANWGANAGLAIARDLLEPVKAKFPWIRCGGRGVCEGGGGAVAG